MATQVWNRGMDTNRAVLEHVRVLLLALAVLVDRAAGLPAARRLHLLAVLAQGEAEVRCLIVAMVSGPGSLAVTAPASATDLCPYMPAEIAGAAALLAARFRMLALAVDTLLAQVGAEPSCAHAGPPRLPGCGPRRALPQFTRSPALRATSPPLAINAPEETISRTRCARSGLKRGALPHRLSFR